MTQYLSTAQAAAYSGLAVKTLRNYAARKIIKAKYFDDRLHFTREDLDAYRPLKKSRPRNSGDMPWLKNSSPDMQR